MTTSFEQFRAAFLDKAIELKNAERSWLESRLRLETCLPPLFDLVHHTYGEIAERYRTPIFGPNPEQGDGASGTILTGWGENPSYLAEYERFKEDLPTIVARILQIERSKIEIERQKVKAKVDLKSQADIEMGDATSSAKSVQQLVTEAVADALKSKGTVRASSAQPPIFINPLLGKGPYAQAKHGEEGPWTSTQGPGTQTWEFIKSDSQGFCNWSLKEELQHSAQESQAQVERQVMAARWDVNHPSTYPDLILLLSRPIAIRCLLRRVPLERLEAARFRSKIHLGPDVHMPDRLAIHVSSGLKYMFPSKINLRLIRDAYSEFCRVLRWRAHFSMQESEDSPYDPDYEVDDELPKKVLSEPLPKYFDDGLTAGEEYVNNYINNFKPAVAHQPKDASLVDVSEVEEYCHNHGLIITPTDKNLGSAVVTAQWLIDGCRVLLSDTQNYQRIYSEEEKVHVLERSKRRVQKLAELPALSEDKQLQKFLVSKVPKDQSSSPTLPRFSGLPKIHKNPWRVRPIVPCHSNMQAPAAKFISKMLKPLVNERPYVLRGSKDLAQRLTSLILPKGKKVWIVTGDIVAFYPNIPRNKAITIVSNWWIRTYGQACSGDMRNLFRLAMIAANEDLLFEFLDETYLQVRGLAMGIACSPDIANLYGAHCEEKFFETPHPEILFFGRFIDDCLSFVIANSEEDAIAKVSSVKYEDLELEWCASEVGAVFLDMRIYIEPDSNLVQWLPYRKRLNHHERIPWISAHPKDVKKGTFLGEMSRLATLSSTRQHYKEAVLDLQSLYIARGYPVDLVKHWTKANLLKRWENRLREPIESSRGVSVLKSEFNPVWETFNIHELRTVIVKRWLDGRNAEPWCNLPNCENVTHFGIVNRLAREAQSRKRTALVMLHEHMADGSGTWSAPDIRESRKARKMDSRLSAGAAHRASSSSSVLEAYASPPEESVPIFCDAPGLESGRLPNSTFPMSWHVHWRDGRHAGVERTLWFDVTRSAFFNNKFLVSRKRTTQMSDLTSTWKKAVLNTFIRSEDEMDWSMDG
jgi:hypothetical protein